MLSRRIGLPALRDEFIFPLTTELDRFFEEFISGARGSTLDRVKATSGFPKINVVEHDGKLQIKASVPGCKAGDIEVEVLQPENKTEGSRLILTGRTSEEYMSPEGSVHHIREMRQSAFRRELVLPKGLEGDPAASLKDGVLTLEWTLPEVEETPRKLIEIKEEE